ncbi:CBF-domain-containing protein [Gloeophyllum trabeum ATCC 11539]|uniref:CBF-domain-containing protein n=1 Tax=Gloeophyllum trabeum (strain ATCC 11539 / FP-39264 / Madison 617) TaxID=670483 RepID=S7PZS3_GLOTA|nr:CBF-domain-containing protein [Gloeophyllum trabeum ATCC 11539]EPQ53171.1 CBF-domain-containing protein [Gloeophyllum trabeum ATCC 11539]
MGRKLKEQVLALGGDEGDLELIKNIEKGGKDDASKAADPNLTKDVSKFLKELKLDGKQPGGKGEADKQSSKKKEGKKFEPQPKEKPVKSGKPQSPEKGGPVEGTPSKGKQADGKPGKGKQKTRDGKKERRKSDAGKKDLPANPTPASDPLPAKSTKIVFDASLLPDKTASASTSKSLSTVEIEATPHWYTLIPPLPPSSTPLPLPTPVQLTSLSKRASDLFAALPPPPTSDASFLSKILQSGTLSDKLSALTLLVQGSPVHNTKALETLKGMAAKGGGRDEKLKACRCIVDWWVGGGGPDRKLKHFRDQPLLHPAVTDTHLVLWHFEDYLKKFFFSFLQILEALTLDPLPYPRMQALSFIYTLLRDKPEQEQNLLRLLVNKLGDPTKQVPSRASYYLLQLLQAHPAMKGIVVREVASLMFRPASSSSSSSLQAAASTSNAHVRFADKEKAVPKADVNMHALYYGAITLNQIVLSHAETDRAVARQLVDVYFKVFEGVVGRGVQEEEKDKEGEGEDAEGDKKGKGKYKGPAKGKGKGKKGKGVEVGFTEVEDANSKLISQVLTGVNRALPYAHLGLGDVSFTNHIDTLFRITHTSTFSTSLQALTLLLQITTTFSTSPQAASHSSLASSITDRFYRTLYGTLLDPRLASTSKHAMYLNLLLKALKLEKDRKGSNERAKAIVRRLVQVLLSGGISASSEVVVGGLWVLGELFSTIPGLRSMLNEPPKASSSKAAGDEQYDPRKRDPQYAHASSTPLWEICPLLNHYHPTVALHARQLAQSKPITSSPDLSLNSLGHFLDRFVYKNPKKRKSETEGDDAGIGKGGSVMQPAAADGTGVKNLKGKVGEDDVVREEGWWKRSADRVPVDQLFFHKYFNEKDKKDKQRAAKKARRKGGEDDDEDDEEEEEREEEDERMESDEGEDEGVDFDEAGDDDVAADAESDADEAEIWKAMKASMKNMDDMGDVELLEDSEDDVPSGLDDVDEEEDEDDDEQGDEEEEGPSEGDESAEEAGAESNDEADEDDAFSLAEASDAEDLIDLDADMPDSLIPYDGSDGESDADEWGGLSGTSNKKRKHKEKEPSRRKKLKSLPTFASYDDYKKLIEDGPEDNI